MILLGLFTLLECHVAAWFCAMFFEGGLIPLLLGCAAITSFLIVGVSYYYSKSDKEEESSYADKAAGFLEGATTNAMNFVQEKLNKDAEADAPKKIDNKRMFLYILCGVICMTIIVLVACFSILVKWYHALLCCLGMALWIYVFVENVMIIMAGERDEDMGSYIVGARGVYGNFLSSFCHIAVWGFGWCRDTCCKKKEAKKEEDITTAGDIATTHGADLAADATKKTD